MEWTVKQGMIRLLAGFLLTCSFLYGEYDLDDRSAVEMGFERGQFQFNILGDSVGKAKFRHRHHIDGGHIDFSHFEMVADVIVWYNECYKEGISTGFGYEYTRMKVNPDIFTRKNYDTAFINATYFTHRVPEWRWIAFFQYNIDADKWSFNNYSTYDMLLWGRWSYCTTAGIHFGIYAETGMKADLVLPVIGIDWKYSERLKINAVFPLNISLIYSLNKNWAVALAGRVFNERHRAGEQGFLRKAVWRYSNGGVELALRYERGGKFLANVHAGYATGGKLKVASMHYHHKHRFHFDGSAYAGAEATASF